MSRKAGIAGRRPDGTWTSRMNMPPPPIENPNEARFIVSVFVGRISAALAEHAAEHPSMGDAPPDLYHYWQNVGTIREWAHALYEWLDADAGQRWIPYDTEHDIRALILIGDGHDAYRTR